MKQKIFLGSILAAAALLVSSTSSANTSEPVTLKLEAPEGPGWHFLRLAEPLLKQHAGLVVDFVRKDGDWMTATAEDSLGRPSRKATWLARRLTDKERAAGWGEEVLGYYGSMLFTHPEAPVDSISWKKWQAYLDLKKEPGALRWSTIADVAPEKDGPVVWILPDATFKAWARPLAFARGFPERLMGALPKAPSREPLAAVNDTGRERKNGLAVHGFDFVLAKLDYVFIQKKVLRIDGIPPTPQTLADGSYKVARPVVLVYDGKLADGESSPIARFKRWLGSRAADVVYENRKLVRPAPGATATH